MIREMIYSIYYSLSRQGLLKLLNINELYLIALVACKNDKSPLINFYNPLIYEP